MIRIYARLVQEGLIDIGGVPSEFIEDVEGFLNARA